MKINPYLAFDGKCREAFDFYHQVLGGEIVAMLTHGDMGWEGIPDELRDRIIHARLVIDDAVIMGGDIPLGVDSVPQGFSVSVQVDSDAEAERIYDALREGGSIQMELQETEWATRFGMMTDRFGTPWMVNRERSDVSFHTG